MGEERGALCFHVVGLTRISVLWLATGDSGWSDEGLSSTFPSRGSTKKAEIKSYIQVVEDSMILIDTPDVERESR